MNSKESQHSLQTFRPAYPARRPPRSPTPTNNHLSFKMKLFTISVSNRGPAPGGQEIVPPPATAIVCVLLYAASNENRCSNESHSRASWLHMNRPPLSPGPGPPLPPNADCVLGPALSYTPRGGVAHTPGGMYHCGSVFEAPLRNLGESVPLWFIFPRFLCPAYVPPLPLGCKIGRTGDGARGDPAWG